MKICFEKSFVSILLIADDHKKNSNICGNLQPVRNGGSWQDLSIKDTPVNGCFINKISCWEIPDRSRQIIAALIAIFL